MASIITTPGFNQINSTNASLNASGGNYIQYNFTSIPNVSKVGKYIGTGAAGNYVDCGFKPAWVMWKNLTSGASNWEIHDASRGENPFLYANLSDSEVSAPNVQYVDNGFVITATGVGRNQLNDEYIFLAFAETSTDSNKAWTDYEYATSQDTLSIQQNTLLSFANGFSSSGQVDTQENVGAGVTYSLGAGHENKHYWLYKDKGGSYGVTEYRPLEGTSRNQADKWGVQSPLDASLRTTAKHFDYESETGVVLGGSENGTYLAWTAFNKLENDLVLGYGWRHDISTGYSNAFLQYKQTEKRVLKSWRLRESNDSTETPKRFTIEGSNDGLNWTAIDSTYTSSDYSGNGAYLWGDLQDTSANTTAYLYHRINITANNGDAVYVLIASLEFNTILPSDYYLINEGVMYEDASDTNLITNGTFDTDTTGWTANGDTVLSLNANRLSVTSSTTSGLGYQAITTESGKKYKLFCDVAISSGSWAIYVGTGAGMSNVYQMDSSTNEGQQYIEFTATTSTTYINLYAWAATNVIYFDNVVVKPENQEDYATPIERIYLAELMTNDDGEVSSYTNLPVAKQKITEAEVQGGLKVHGEIENRGMCTAWVTFDGSVNPPLIRNSYNVKDVVDAGTGLYKVIFEEQMDHTGYVVNAQSNTWHTYASPIGIYRTKAFATVGTGDATHTAVDSLTVDVQIFGGKDVR